MEQLSQNIIRITKKMRSTAYEMGKTTNEYDRVPFGGSIRESIGPFPEFILKGRFCRRSVGGMCSPCFYSRLPMHDITQEQYDMGYEMQVEYIKSHFAEIVKANQFGKVAVDFSTSKPIYGMVCTPTGSYFDDNEYPLQIRIQNLARIISMAEENQCEIVLHIESHAEDVISYFENPSNEELLLLKRLHTRVLLGFESVNEFSRNVVYSKNLSLSTFEKAVGLLHDAGFAVGAFVFVGLIGMTDTEIIEDSIDSFQYLKRLGASPVLMCANTQSYTIPDVLSEAGRYKLLDPRTVYEIINNIIDIFGCNMNACIDPWFIADPVGGPPEPSTHLFNANTSTVCPTCAKKIYSAIEALRITKDSKEFKRTIEEVKKCSCYQKYDELLNCQELVHQVSLAQRVNAAVDFADEEFQYYVLRRNPWKVKAELLCYGLKLSESQMREISKINPYIYEKGFINAAHIMFEDALINVCVADRFCQKSPYTLTSQNSHWILQKNGVNIGNIEFLYYPDWTKKRINNISIGSIIRPHSDKCLSIWPSTDCSYLSCNQGCKFCGLTSNKKKVVLTASLLVDMIEEAMKYNPAYEINMSGGTYINPDKSVEYLSFISKSITDRFGHVPISVECVPPENDKLLTELHNSGVDAIVMNLEIYDDELRARICPGKSIISRTKYFESLKHAVAIFGKGNVSSVLIIGIQPFDDIKKAIAKLVSIGVVPTLIPIKPLDDTEFATHETANSEEYIQLSRLATLLMRKNGLVISEKTGCAACGACSLETDLKEALL